ncbi:MAG: hypothetical protein E5W81_22000 [Mesorhizobium sp.]|nr:MAG: hypothetical protein E5V36_12730 [Mesorhizobium sp.]TKB57108.1 MAG: hypothetical protein E5W81_22000 [Mesorhizobium sp.]
MGDMHQQGLAAEKTNAFCTIPRHPVVFDFPSKNAADSRLRIDFFLAARRISAIQLVLLRFGTD